MKEQDIEHLIIQDMCIGWWKADTSCRMVHLSDSLREMLRFPMSDIGFDEFKSRVPVSYVRYFQPDSTWIRRQDPIEFIMPIIMPDGRQQRFALKVLRRESMGNEEVLLIGSAMPIHRQSEHATKDHARIDGLLYRLTSISHTLLSLLRTDRAEGTINKILSEILNMFRGGRAYIIEFDWKNRMHHCTFEVTATGVSAEQEYVNQICMDDMTWWTEQISQGLPIILSSLDELPPEACRERLALEDQHIKSMIVMPLGSQNGVWGYAGIDIVEEHRQWTNEDCQWFTSLVNIIGLCMELQRSESAAQKDRAYLQSLYRHMPLGYVRMKMIYDDSNRLCDFRILDANDASDDIFEMSRQAYVGLTGSQLGIDLRFHLSGLLEVQQTGTYVKGDLCIDTERGRYLHYVLYSTGEDEITGFFLDQTEIFEAHETIQRNEKLLRNIFDNIQVGVELYAPDGKLVDINHKDMEIFGINRKEEALGLDFYQNPLLPSHIREGVRRGIDQAFYMKYPFDHLNGYYESRKTGFLEIYTTVNMLYDSQGRLANFMLINIDNTEINRAHTRLAEFETSFALVSSLGKMGYCRYDLRTKEGSGVPQWYLNLGEKPDMSFVDLINNYPHVDPSDRKAIKREMERIKARESDSFNMDLHILNDNGSENWTRINVVRNPMNNDPEQIEIVGVNYDITELKQTEKRLIEAKNKAEVSDLLKSAFLANMSHEIRTPLNAIIGFSNLLAETDDPQEREEYIHVVEENNDLLLKLISDILDLSKIEAGTFDFNYGPVDVNQMCEEVIRSLSLKVRDHTVRLQFVHHETPCRIRSDKNRLTQIIINFVNNALKFTTKGSITLDYVLQGDVICFSVEDTGRGIDKNQQKTIFERFVKLNNFVQGTGLGLSISKSIVEQMGGQIGVESAVGKGSRFWFTVPTGLCPADSKMERISVAPCTLTSNSRNGKRPLLLVAEDIDSNYMLILLMLRKEYEVIRAANGEEAVRLCELADPDAVLMDIRMPILDGLEATRRIRKSGNQVPIIAVTAFAYDHDRRRALDAGCDDYLAKPLMGDTLRLMLNRLLHGLHRK